MPGPEACCHAGPLSCALSLDRKCKLVTSGPWLEVAPIALGDVSIIPESPEAEGHTHSIALWAVSDKGDVLCRLGVSELNPAVSTSWLLLAGRPVLHVLPKIGSGSGVRLAQGSPGLPRTVPVDGASQWALWAVGAEDKLT